MSRHIAIYLITIAFAMPSCGQGVDPPTVTPCYIEYFTETCADYYGAGPLEYSGSSRCYSCVTSSHQCPNSFYLHIHEQTWLVEATVLAPADEGGYHKASEEYIDCFSWYSCELDCYYDPICNVWMCETHFMNIYDILDEELSNIACF